MIFRNECLLFRDMREADVDFHRLKSIAYKAIVTVDLEDSVLMITDVNNSKFFVTYAGSGEKCNCTISKREFRNIVIILLGVDLGTLDD